MGPQAAAEELKLPAELPDLAPPPIAPNIDKAFSLRSLPQDGQTSFTWAEVERTNFSYFSPQS